MTVLDSSWVDEDFVSADEEMTQTTYTQLRLGDQGQEVQNLQARLGELGYYSGEVTGVFDTLTEQAVQLFELTFGTMQTGIATSGMQALLFDENAPAYGSEAYNNARSDTYETLQLGDVGSGVLALQYRLQELGYPLENANGQYDAATAKAVSLFYEEYGLAANDVAIIAMQEALFASDAHRYSGQRRAALADCERPGRQPEPGKYRHRRAGSAAAAGRAGLLSGRAHPARSTTSPSRPSCSCRNPWGWNRPAWSTRGCRPSCSARTRRLWKRSASAIRVAATRF